MSIFHLHLYFFYRSVNCNFHTSPILQVYKVLAKNSDFFFKRISLFTRFIKTYKVGIIFLSPFFVLMILQLFFKCTLLKVGQMDFRLCKPQDRSQVVTFSIKVATLKLGLWLLKLLWCCGVPKIVMGNPNSK